MSEIGHYMEACSRLRTELTAAEARVTACQEALRVVDSWLDLNYGYLVEDDPSLIQVGDAVRSALAALTKEDTDE